MKLLAIDTSFSALSMAICVDDNMHLTHVYAPMQQTKLLLPTLKKMLQELNLRVTDLDAICYGSGPGSFTGVRIACTAAQGLAFAADKPIIPISSLAGLAVSAFMQHGWKNILVAQDARMGKILWSAYLLNDDGLISDCQEDRACLPADVCLNLQAPEWWGVGDAWQDAGLKPCLEQNLTAIDSQLLPSAAAILQLAKPVYLSRGWGDAKRALPTYLR